MDTPPEQFRSKTHGSIPVPLPADSRLLGFVARQPKIMKGLLLAVAVFGAGSLILLSYISLITKGPPKVHGADKAQYVSKTTSPGVKLSQSHTSSSTSGGSNSTPTPYPSTILDLTNWKLTLPLPLSDNKSNATEIDQPQLTSYDALPYFQVDAARDGVQFQAPVNGATTSGSNFPRSELREMVSGGQQNASWSTTSGVNTMTVREAITHLPASRSQLVSAQIHGPSAYVILVRLNGSDLFVEGPNGKNLGNLNTNYKLGTIFTVQIAATNGVITVSYNGAQKVRYTNTSSGNYFKAGCYTQDNLTYGGSSSDYGQVIIYSLSVQHS